MEPIELVVLDVLHTNSDFPFTALCPALIAPKHGRILGGQRKSVDDQAYVVCDPGYELTGNEERTCMANGSWSGNAANCYSNPTL